MADIKNYIPGLGQNSSLTVGSGDIDAKVIQYISQPITSAQLLALNTTPVTVIPAPGAGFATVVDYAVVESVGSGAYTAGGTTGLFVGPGTTTLMAGPAGTNIFFAGGLGSTAYMVGINNTIIAANQPITFGQISATAYTIGSATALVSLWYSTIPQ